MESFFSRFDKLLVRPHPPWMAPVREAALSALIRTIPDPDSIGSGCLIYTGPKHTTGYGLTPGDLSKNMFAHKLVYEAAFKDVPPRHQIDHYCHYLDSDCVDDKNCRHRLCLNIDHLFPITAKDRRERKQERIWDLIDRGVIVRTGNHKVVSHQAAKTHCPKGHPYSEANTYLNPKTGSRNCRACKRISDYNRYHLGELPKPHRDVINYPGSIDLSKTTPVWQAQDQVSDPDETQGERS